MYLNTLQPEFPCKVVVSKVKDSESCLANGCQGNGLYIELQLKVANLFNQDISVDIVQAECVDFP